MGSGLVARLILPPKRGDTLSYAGEKSYTMCNLFDCCGGHFLGSFTTTKTSSPKRFGELS